MKGILIRAECPSCGNILQHQTVLLMTATGNKVSFEMPTRCGCGRKGAFNLLNFEPLSVGFATDEEDMLNLPKSVANEVQQFAINKIKEQHEEEKNEN